MVNQDQIDKILFSCLGYAGSDIDDYLNDCKIIQNIIKEEFNIFLSICECGNFWHWRSEKYDASWLVLYKKEDILKKDIKEFFPEYLKYLEE